MIVIVPFLLFLAICAFLLSMAVFRRKIHIWLPSYCSWLLRRALRPQRRPTRPVHILFCFVDHFEPGWNKADPETRTARVDAWAERYPLMARKFKDADGFHPRHTWFYPPHYFEPEHVVKLVRLCKDGLGDIEMHLHHSRMEPFPDTSETLRRKIQDCVDLYSRYGIFQTNVNGIPQRRYAFIHGDWALDNSRTEYCGVSNELTILKETGCYADFTFPSYMIESQPKMTNVIYYAKDEPSRPKSYEKGEEVRVGVRNGRDLMMIQGPLTFRWKSRRHFRLPAVEDGEISGNNPPTKDRVDSWIRTAVHVSGKEDWVIVKVFTHGAPGEHHEVLLGEGIQEMHSYLAERYNDGRDYFLHYVTARELHNIIRAAEDGCNGGPGAFRDYEIAGYEYV